MKNKLGPAAALLIAVAAAVSLGAAGTPTPAPTCAPGAQFVQSQVLATGCFGNGMPTSFTATVLAAPDSLLLVQVEMGAGIPVLGATLNGVAMEPLPSDNPVPLPSGTGAIYGFYLVNPPAGASLLALSVTAGCSWNVVMTQYADVNTASPFGDIETSMGNSTTFTDKLLTVDSSSIIHDFIAYPSGPFNFSGLSGSQLFAPGASGCCDDVYGSWLATTAPGMYALNYATNAGSTVWISQTIEIAAAAPCGSPTSTPSPRGTMTPTVTATATRTGSSASATPSVTPTDTPSATPTDSPTPTPTVTQTAPPPPQSPTVGTTCAPGAQFVQSQVLATGCFGNGMPTSFTATVLAAPDSLLLVQVEMGSSIPVLGATLNGFAMAALPSDNPVPLPSGTGAIYAFYMVNPPAGASLLALSVTAGCSWNVVMTQYADVNTASPFGDIETSLGNSTTFTDKLLTVDSSSIIHDFIAYPSGPFNFSGLSGSQLFAPDASGCCEDVYGSWMATTAPGMYALNYATNAGSTVWISQTIEIAAAAPCGSPTSTPSPRGTMTPTCTLTASPRPTLTPTLTQTLTPSQTAAGPVPSWSPTQTGTTAPTFAVPTPLPGSCAGNYLLQWGSNGSGAGQFADPFCVAISPSGTVYVTDAANNRVEEFTIAGVYVGQWGTGGNGNGQFSFPVGIALGASGNVYVADTLNARVQEFTATGTYVTQWGGNGAGNGQFANPYGLAVAPLGNVYVADTGNARIQEFTANGTYLAQWGGRGTGNGQFTEISGIAVGPSGSVYVLDNTNARVQVFSSSGVYQSQWGSFGSGVGQFATAWELGVDGSGNIYVGDTGNDRVQEFSPAGVFMTLWGSPGTGNGQFNAPQGVGVDSAGDVYVADEANRRVEKFGCGGPAPVATRTPSPSATPTARTTPGGGACSDSLVLRPNLLRGYNAHCLIAFMSCSTGTGKLRIMNMHGRTVNRLWQGGLLALKTDTVDWDGRNEQGEDLASGVYSVVFTDAAGRSLSQKVLIVR
jgi:hypothetical protein